VLAAFSRLETPLLFTSVLPYFFSIVSPVGTGGTGGISSLALPTPRLRDLGCGSMLGGGTTGTGGGWVGICNGGGWDNR